MSEGTKQYVTPLDGSPKAPLVISIDPARRGGDYTAEVDFQIKADGAIQILDIRRYRETIDLAATDVTDQKKIEAK